jgi:hypothetical protein
MLPFMLHFNVKMYVFLHASIIYMYVCMYVRTYVCMHACMYVCVYVYVYVCRCVYAYVCMYVCSVYMHAYDLGILDPM